jgi:ATP-dependent Zn protease
VPKKSRKFTQLEMTAYHEAGHVIAARQLRYKVKYATIKPNGDSLGHVAVPGVITRRHYERLQFGEITPAFRDKIEKTVILDFAGYIAEKHFAGKAEFRFSHLTDTQKATDKLCFVCSDWGKELYHYSNYLFERSRNLVLKHWVEVDAVAQALLERTTVLGEDLNAIADKSIGRKRPKLDPTK